MKKVNKDHCKYDTIHKTNITVEGLDNLHNE